MTGFARGARALALATGIIFGLGCEPPQPPPRIVLIVVDTLRADYLSPYSRIQTTPHVESLARKGQVFTRAYSSFHQTTMSMAALFTGRVPSLESQTQPKALAWNGKTWCGMRRFAANEDARCIPDELPLLAEKLQDAGYWTIGVVTNTLLFQPLGYERGFSQWTEIGRLGSSNEIGGIQANPPRERAAKKANEAIASLLDQRPTDHFFLYAHYMEAHDYSAHGVTYAVGVQRSDQAIGALIDILETRDLLDGTTIFLLSDHGERLAESHFLKGSPRHFGNPSFEEVLHVPLIVAPPQPHEDTDAIRRSDDVHRMILGVAGIDIDEPGELNDGEHFLSEQRYQTYRDGPWKSYRRRGEEAIALVNLETDPGERKDVSKEHPSITEKHRIRLEEISKSLAVRIPDDSQLTPEDQRRLRALGYLGPDDSVSP